ncbi:MAG: 1-acyl-sn-glycerol-3-phosphate acyltransferase [Pyrinomonadaceae bacterium]|nr:1-acyl-sn-glycerol-3-phosphate acyltransferase [Pyrinomonadaceae bacterium]MBA3568876.1 1-acyl-sn-glycerol-3-phosphate acyltransferase [Pyrinomonadaceae bacterium]
MNDSVTISRERSTGRSKPGEFVLPQWAINSMRPAFRLIGHTFWDLKLRGIQNIPQNGGLIIASNHQSYLDPFAISVPIKRPIRFLAWNEVLNWPFVGKVMRVLGAWPLQVEGSDPAAIRRSHQWLREGGAVMIFPEGGRGQPDGSMVRFKAGAVRIALEARVPILPVTIRGANRAWPRGRLIPGRGKIEIIYHPIFHPQQQPEEDARACARRESEQLAGIIRSAL